MFSLQLSKTLASRLVRPLAMLAVAALAAPGSAQAASTWATVGSTGIVDESCYMAIQMDNFEARLLPGLLYPCRVRYQVTDTFAGAGTVSGLALYAHIRDTNAATSPGKVVVRLLTYPFSGAVPPASTIIIDSDAVAAPAPLANGFRQYRFPVASCATPLSLDFTANTYWIEVDLTPGAVPVLPGLAIGSLQLRPCI